MRTRGLFEMSVNLLDKNGFILRVELAYQGSHSRTNETNQSTKEDKRTCTFALHKFVMPPIFEPDTPGGLRASMDWSKFSSSATAEDMTAKIYREVHVRRVAREKRKRDLSQRFMQREVNKGPGYCVTTRWIIPRYGKKICLNGSLAILHYRLHERIHCRPENSRLQLEYSLAILCPERLSGAEYESTGSTGDVQPRASSFVVRSQRNKNQIRVYGFQGGSRGLQHGQQDGLGSRN